ncbi:hypothetical protein E6O75_ATG00311 [Venturia nashicola]|uniref:Uncharacterized protein n=1 Tax=Venturia nashicola TaxID=86259 RepID=A0A4Z1PNE3_9PEZI|nr:hypothetical protein E6O75_ATG00311 [Venturia nashicola]
MSFTKQSYDASSMPKVFSACPPDVAPYTRKWSDSLNVPPVPPGDLIVGFPSKVLASAPNLVVNIADRRGCVGIILNGAILILYVASSFIVSQSDSSRSPGLFRIGAALNLPNDNGGREMRQCHTWAQSATITLMKMSWYLIDECECGWWEGGVKPQARQASFHHVRPPSILQSHSTTPSIPNARSLPDKNFKSRECRQALLMRASLHARPNERPPGNTKFYTTFVPGRSDLNQSSKLEPKLEPLYEKNCRVLNPLLIPSGRGRP